MAAGPAPATIRRPGMRRGTRAGMVVLNLACLCVSPVFWFAWSQRTAFSLPEWAQDAAGFTGGILPVMMFAAAWCAAAVHFGHGRRQAAGTAFNVISSLGLLAAAAGMLALTSAGLDG